MTQFRTLLLASAATAFAVSTFAADRWLPPGWEGMEIEAKWDLTAEQYAKVLHEFPDKSERYGLTVRIRWSGVPRKFVDVYYDDATATAGAGGTLTHSRHVLRHRTRFSSTGLTADPPVSSLIAAKWSEDWQRAQYKSDPCRLDATWFRTESGDCNIADKDGEEICATGAIAASALFAGKQPNHPALVAMAKDHPKLAVATLKPFLTVVDYRYRVELRRGETAIYEISLDRIVEGDDPKKTSHELEIELLETPTRPTVEQLLTIANDLQTRFSLKPSTKSKGGTTDVPLCAAPSRAGR